MVSPPSPESPYFRNVYLFTRSGDFVVSIQMPAFVIMPEAVQWGARTFLRGELMAHNVEKPKPGYYEVFNYHVPDPAKLKELV